MRIPVIFMRSPDDSAHAYARPSRDICAGLPRDVGSRQNFCVCATQGIEMNRFPRTAIVMWWIVKVASVGLFILFANESPAHAKRLSDYLCERYCDRLDPVLDRIDEWVRDKMARRRGDIALILAPRVPGHGPFCGQLPTDSQKIACCADERSQLWIEFSGGKNPYAQKARYKAICKP